MSLQRIFNSGLPDLLSSFDVELQCPGEYCWSAGHRPRRLSVLCCSIKERANQRRRLLRNLAPQLNFETELLLSLDNREMTYGQKRNALLARACGDYIVYVDDDDLVAPNYIDLILTAISPAPDVVGINLVMTQNGGNAERSFHSLQIQSWHDEPYPAFGPQSSRRIYFRSPNHLNPVRRDLAIVAGFPDEGIEDYEYSRRLLPLLRTEIVIEQPIYFYLFDSTRSTQLT